MHFISVAISDVMIVIPERNNLTHLGSFYKRQSILVKSF